MANVNMFILQGVIPSFDGAIKTYNIADEKKACAHIKLAVKTAQKNEQTGYYESDIFDVVFFGKMAQTIEKIAKPKTALIVQGSILPAKPRTDANGAPMVGADGKAVYSPMSLRASTFSFQEGNSNGNGTKAHAAPAAPAAAPVDPFSMPVTAPGAAAPQFPFPM
jgi:single-stranded DNA-binding protein